MSPRAATMSPREARLLGRRSALGGKAASTNPFTGGYAARWREGWTGVAAADRGSEPEADASLTVMTPRGKGVRAAPGWGM